MTKFKNNNEKKSKHSRRAVRQIEWKGMVAEKRWFVNDKDIIEQRMTNDWKNWGYRKEWANSGEAY